MQKITCTLKAASEASGLSVRKLYDLIAQNKLKSVRVGRRRLVVVESLEQVLLGRAAHVGANPRRREAAVEAQ